MSTATVPDATPETPDAAVGTAEGYDFGARDDAWAGVVVRWRTVRGQRVRTLVYEGADAAAAGATPILLVHGLGGAATNWLEVIPTLGRRGPVVVPDLPGFGFTPPHPQGSSRIRANVSFLEALVDELGWSSVEVHGNSMGGLISTLFAARNPQSVRRLVLVDPALPTDPRRALEADPLVIARFAPFMLGMGRFVLRKAWERSSAEDMLAQTIDLVYAEPEQLRPAMRAMALANIEAGRDLPWRIDGMADAARSLVGLLLARRCVLRAIDEIVAPTLLVWGDRDRLVGRAAMDVATSHRPDWTFTVLEGIGHAPMVEDPAGFLAAVDDWRQRTEVTVA